MERKNFDELIAYMGSLWGREVSYLARAGGWKLLQSLPNEAVEGAVVAIAESGLDRMPTWPLVYKTAQALAETMRQQMPALPQGDSLSDEEHEHVMRQLRARQTPEQRRRADRMTSETKELPMKIRIRPAGELLRLNERIDASGWDLLFEARISEEASRLEAAKR